MPKRAKYADLDLPPGPLRELTLAIRTCCMILSDGGVSLAGIADVSTMSKSVVSDLLNGHRKRPQAEQLQSLHALAEKRAGSSNHQLPALDEMLRLQERVCAEADHGSSCKTCRRPWDAAKPDALEPASIPDGKGDKALPVHRSGGDRQGEWADMADVLARLAAGQVADAAGILRHVGRDGDAVEAAVAAATCHRQGLPDAASTVVSYAAQRADEEIIFIVGTLLDGGDLEIAKQLVALRLERS